MTTHTRRATLFPYTTLFRSAAKQKVDWPKQSAQTEFLPKTREKLKRGDAVKIVAFGDSITAGGDATEPKLIFWQRYADALDRKSTRLNSSHPSISYAVFCLK